jgi:hypothetical protein
LRCCILLYVDTVLAHITLKFINDSLQQTKNKSHHSNKSCRTTVTTAATRAMQQQQQEQCSNSNKSNAATAAATRAMQQLEPHSRRTARATARQVPPHTETPAQPTKL